MSVTLDVWRVPSLARAVMEVARTSRGLRRDQAVEFGKVLGTGDGRTFTMTDATPHRWAVLTVGPRPDLLRRWDSIAEEHWLATLDPLTSRGRWSGQQPFGRPLPRRHDGPVAALTRARITSRKLITFWRAVPPVAADLHGTEGLLASLGVGEAPIGLQGTFSVWRSAADLTRFAYERPAHLDAVRRTGTERWYAEELFARFALLETSGTLDGRSVP